MTAPARPLRLVHGVGWYRPDSLGGTEVYVEALVERLAAAGHRVSVAVPWPVADPDAAEPRRETREGIEVFRYPVPAEATRDEVQARRPVRGAHHLARHLEEEAPDVVHLHTFVPGLDRFELHAARRAGARLVVTTHSPSLGHLCLRGTLLRWGEVPCDGVVEVPRCAACALQARGLPKPLARLGGRVPGAVARRARRLLPEVAGTAVSTALAMPELVRHNRRLQAETLATVDRFVVLTEAARRMVVAEIEAGPAGEANDADEADGADDLAGRVVVQRLGIVPRELPPDAPRDPLPRVFGPDRPLRLVYLGRLDPIKGVEDLVAAMVSLPATAPVTLDVVGPAAGETERRTRERLRARAAGDPRIRLIDPVAPEDVPALLAARDLLVCPSRVFEGGPTVALEARAVGTPVIGTTLGGLAEIVRPDRDGALVPPGDRRALARLLGELVGRPERIEAWRRAVAEEPVRTLDDVAREVEALYREIMDREILDGEVLDREIPTDTDATETEAVDPPPIRAGETP